VPFLESGFTQTVYSFGPGDVWVHHADKLYGLSNGVLFQKTLPNNVGLLQRYLRTPTEHHLFFSGTLWSFSGDDPANGSALPTFFVPTGATVDGSATIYVRAAGGVLKRY
jgi:hypothetical protein